MGWAATRRTHSATGRRPRSCHHSARLQSGICTTSTSSVRVRAGPIEVGGGREARQAQAQLLTQGPPQGGGSGIGRAISGGAGSGQGVSGQAAGSACLARRSRSRAWLRADPPELAQDGAVRLPTFRCRSCALPASRRRDHTHRRRDNWHAANKRAVRAYSACLAGRSRLRLGR